MIEKSDTTKSDTTNLPILEEKISPKFRQALMGNFRNGNEAVNELIDNCMADKMSKRELDISIHIDAKNKELIITNKNGFGMSLQEAQNFLTWGEPGGRGLSRWGVGGKAAIGYLGTGFVLQFKSFQEKNAYEIQDLDWERRDDSTGLAKYEPKTVNVPVNEYEGFVTLQIIGLKLKIDEKKLKEHITNVYRRALIKGDATIRIGSVRIDPLELPVYDVFRNRT